MIKTFRQYTLDPQLKEQELECPLHSNFIALTLIGDVPTLSVLAAPAQPKMRVTARTFVPGEIIPDNFMRSCYFLGTYLAPDDNGTDVVKLVIVDD